MPDLTFRPVLVEPPSRRLRRMAAEIQSPEQLEQILNDVDGPPELREAVRAMLVPLLTFEVPDATIEG